MCQCSSFFSTVITKGKLELVGKLHPNDSWKLCQNVNFLGLRGWRKPYHLIWENKAFAWCRIENTMIICFPVTPEGSLRLHKDYLIISNVRDELHRNRTDIRECKGTSGWSLNILIDSSLLFLSVHISLKKKGEFIYSPIYNAFCIFSTNSCKFVCKSTPLVEILQLPFYSYITVFYHSSSIMLSVPFHTTHYCTALKGCVRMIKHLSISCFLRAFIVVVPEF